MSPEEVHHDVMFKLRHALACTILLAIMHAYKYSWLLKPRFSPYFAGGSEGLSRLKGLLLKTNIVELKIELKIGLNFKGYTGEPLARSTVDALNEGRKYCLPIYTLDVHAGHVTS